MSDEQIFDIDVGEMPIFTFHSSRSVGKRIEPLRKRFPDMKEFNFTMHDTRRIRSKQILETQGMAEA